MSILIYKNSDDRIHEVSLQEFEKRLGIKYLHSLVFASNKYKEHIIKKTEKRLKRLNLKKMNLWMLALHQNEMERSKNHFFYVRWINHDLGYGVFAAQDIPALCYVGEYLGVVCKRSGRKHRFNDYIFSYTVTDKNTPYIIDAQQQGNFTRFINHDDYHPNLISRWVVKDGLTHIILFTNRSVKKNQQLTYDYGDYYWRSRPLPLSISEF